LMSLAHFQVQLMLNKFRCVKLICTMITSWKPPEWMHTSSEFNFRPWLLVLRQVRVRESMGLLPSWIKELPPLTHKSEEPSNDYSLPTYKFKVL
jgi:hypothetical protein